MMPCWPEKNPGRFGPIPVRPGRFGPISGVSRFGPVGAGRFGPISGIIPVFGPRTKYFLPVKLVIEN